MSKKPAPELPLGYIGRGEDKRAASLLPGFKPAAVLAAEKIEAGGRQLATDFCMDWECGHRRHMHKGGTGYCHMPGCSCLGMVLTDADILYFRRNEHAGVQSKP
jgi:hypothetical protein